MEDAMLEAQDADIFLVIGTSMQVYPAAGLIDFVPAIAPKYVIDPNRSPTSHYENLHFIEKSATSGMEELKTNFY